MVSTPTVFMVAVLVMASLPEFEAVGGRHLLQTEPDPYDTGVPMLDDELIVKFKPTADSTKKGNALGKGRGSQKKTLRTGNGATSGDVVLIGVTDELGNKPTKTKLKEAAAAIKTDPEVEYAEPNYLLNNSQAVTNDPYYASLWGMMDTDAGANAKGAWAAGYQNCSGVVIGVIDTGIQITHPDLQSAIWTNPGEIPGNGKDDDNNGKVDDVNGWDFFNNDATPYDDTYDNHGTHVAGTIGAEGNNGIGVVGVCQRGVKIIPAKFLGGSSGTGNVANAVSALYYLLDLKNRYDLNMVATSNSWGGGGFSQTMYDAISAHNNAGILFIAAAGNAAVDTDTTPNYPSGYNIPNVISVGSIAQNGVVSSFSNYGATTVDVFAPGSSIISTFPSNSYTTLQGTSMAAPHVTGAIALYAANHKRVLGTYPTATAIKDLVFNSGVTSSYYTGKSVTGRRLNVYNMMATLPLPSPSPAPPVASPSPAPAAMASPSPRPASPSPAPAAAVPSPDPQAPAVPSPSPDTPPPPPITPPPPPPAEENPNPPPAVDPNDPRPRMKSVLTLTPYFDSRKGRKWFYCHARITAAAVETGAAISGFTVQGTWGVSPDADKYTDFNSEMSYPVTGDIGSHTTGTTDSPWIPVKGALTTLFPTLYPETYPGTKCVFALTGLTHTDYVWDPAVSATYIRSAQL